MGLFETIEQATQIASYIQEANDLTEKVRQEITTGQHLPQLPSMKGEPGLWLPWLVVRYSLKP